MRRGGKPVKPKPPVAPKSRKNEGSRVRDLEKRLAEAIKRETEALKREAGELERLQQRNRELHERQEQQTPTAGILRVIASSPTDLQPVLDTVAENAARVCGADDATIARLEGDVFRTLAGVGPVPKLPPDERWPVLGTV